MIITVRNSRLELELTRARALKLIEQLSQSVAQANVSGSAWFADGIVVQNASDEQAAGRITIRVEW